MQSFIDLQLALFAWTAVAVLLSAVGAVIFWAPISRARRAGMARPPALTSP